MSDSPETRMVSDTNLSKDKIMSPIEQRADMSLKRTQTSLKKADSSLSRTDTPLERTKSVLDHDTALSPFLFGYIGFVSVISLFICMIAIHYINDVILAYRYENFKGGFTFWGNMAQFLGCVSVFVMQIYKCRMVYLFYMGLLGRSVSIVVFGILVMILGYRNMNVDSRTAGQDSGELGYLIAITLCFSSGGISSACTNQLIIAGAIGMKEFKYSGAWSVGQGLSNLVGFLMSMIPLTSVNRAEGGVPPITPTALWFIFVYFLWVSSLYIIGHIWASKRFWQEPGMRNLLEYGDWEGERKEETSSSTSMSLLLKGPETIIEESPNASRGSSPNTSPGSSPTPSPPSGAAIKKPIAVVETDENTPLVVLKQGDSVVTDNLNSADNKVTWLSAFKSSWALMASMIVSAAYMWVIFPITITAIRVSPNNNLSQFYFSQILMALCFLCELTGRTIPFLIIVKEQSKKKAEQEAKLMALAEEETRALIGPEKTKEVLERTCSSGSTGYDQILERISATPASNPEKIDNHLENPFQSDGVNLNDTTVSRTSPKRTSGKLSSAQVISAPDLTAEERATRLMEQAKNYERDVHGNPESNSECYNVFTNIVMFGGNQFVLFAVSILRGAILIPLFLYMPTTVDIPPNDTTELMKADIEKMNGFKQWLLYQDGLKILLVVLFFFSQGWISTGIYQSTTLSTKSGKNGDERTMIGAYIALGIASGLMLGSTIAIAMSGAFGKAATFSKKPPGMLFLGF